MKMRVLTFVLAALVVVIALLGAIKLSAQTPQKPIETARAEAIKLPAKLSVQLKAIQERQEALAKEYQVLETQKIIVAQRAALELHLTAEQIDQMDLIPESDGGYAFKPKPKPPTKTPENKNP